MTPGPDGEFDRVTLERAGHPVEVCRGPATHEPCPLLADATCPMFERAHGIVFKLDLDRPDRRSIVRRYRDIARPDLPIRVLGAPGDDERFPELRDVEIWTHEPNVADLDGFAAEVEAADRLAPSSGPRGTTRRGS